MNVQPADLIEHLRHQAAARHVVARRTVRACRDLYARFQRIRWSLVDICRNRQDIAHLQNDWRKHLNTPTAAKAAPVAYRLEASPSGAFNRLVEESNARACFTCGECTSACPVTIERSTFDPMWLVRMAGFGLEKQMLQASSIWLCIGCRRCSEACPQRVSAHRLIEKLQQMAIDEGVVPVDFRFTLQRASQTLYHKYLDEIDRLLARQPAEGSLAFNFYNPADPD
jgi:heterodisulfide reductase subunit C